MCLKTYKTLPFVLALMLAGCGQSPTVVTPAVTTPGVAPPPATGTEAVPAGANAPQSQFGLGGLDPVPVAAVVAPVVPAVVAPVVAAVPVVAAPVVAPVVTPVVATAVLPPSGFAASAALPVLPTSTAAFTMVPTAPVNVFGTNRLIAFASTRVTGGMGGFDIFLYDDTSKTVYAVPAANTPANEVHPMISPNGRFLVYASNFTGRYRVLAYDLLSQTIDPLPVLNDPSLDQTSPSIDDSGTRIAYLASAPVGSQLRIYSAGTGEALIPATVARLSPVILTPRISGDGNWIAFSAGATGNSDIFLYSVVTATVQSPPFVNTVADEIDPYLSEDGTHMLFASNRTAIGFGIFEADLVAGFVNNLALVNASGSNVMPEYVTGGTGDVVYQTNAAGNDQLMVYHLAGGFIDTLPILHEPGEDDILGSSITADPGSVGAGSLTGGLTSFAGAGVFGVGGFAF